jgi:hypothetical protein
MSVIARNLFPDGFSVIQKGVNSDLAPNVLPFDQIAWLVNGQTRRGFLSQRPGWGKKLLSGDEITPGFYQGGALFLRWRKMVLSVGGDIYSVNLLNMEVSKLTGGASQPTRNPSYLHRAWFCEAEDFMIIQDGQSGAFIYDGSTLRRADPAFSEVPTGTCMAYSQGRLWVTLPNRRSYVGSDLVFGPSGTPAYGRRDAILKFTENTLIAGGGAFGVPFRAGEIVSMVPLGQTDTSLGQGPLQVFCTGGAFSVSAPYLRTSWADVTFPIQSASLLGAGALSDWSTVNVNGDIWYRGLQGARSFQVARRDFGTWTNTPLSNEVVRAFERDISTDLLAWSSGALFDNRLLLTIGPYSNYDYGIVHRGLVVLDFDPVSGITVRNQPPVWDGEWSGLPILQIMAETFVSQDRCFAVTLASSNAIEIWELSKDSHYDNDGQMDRLITWEIEGASYSWRDKGWSLKQLEWGDIWYDQIADDLAFTVYYRPDQEPNWQLWYNWQSCATTNECHAVVDPNTGCAPAPQTLARQYRVRQRFPSPSVGCDEITGKPYRRGFEFQPRLVIQGPCRIKKFRLMAGDCPEDANGGCVNNTTCTKLEACLPDSLDFDSATAPARG